MLRRKAETSSNASALSILFRFVMTTLKSNKQGYWASGARDHQLLFEIRFSLIGNRIDGLVRKLVALTISLWRYPFSLN